MSADTIAENSAFGTVIGDVSAVDSDSNAVLTYSLADNAGGRFNIDATTGELTVGYGFLLDYETQTSHQITVQVSDQNGVSFEKNFTIGVTDVVEGPPLPTDDVIGGTSGNDVLDGHGGNDELVGYGGNDTFVFNQGYGKLQIVQVSDGEGGPLGTLTFGAGILPSDISVAATSDGDVILSVGTNGDQVTIAGMANDTQLGIDSVHFDNGATWSRQDVLNVAQTDWVGSSAGAELHGYDFGINRFAFGAGEEIAYGGAAGNLYSVSSSSGQATIQLSSVLGSTNEIDFSSGISSNDLWFEKSGNDLNIDLLGTQTDVTVSDWFADAGGQLQGIVAGGLTIDSQVSQLVQAMASYATSHSGFEPGAAGTTMPADSTLQTAIAASWHA